MSWLHDAAILAAALACVARVVARPHGRVAWALIAVGLLAWALGELVWSLHDGGDAATPPTLSDALWLAWYPLTGVGIGLLIRLDVGHFELHRWMDGLAVTLLVMTPAVALFLEPVAAESDQSTLATAIEFGYPILDALVVGAILGVYSLLGWRPGRAWLLLGLGAILMAIGDALFAVQKTRDSLVDDRFDLIWALGAVLIAAAAWSSVPSGAPHVLPSGWRAIALPLAAQAIAASIQVYALFHELGESERIVTLAVLLIAMVQIVVSRPRDDDPLEQREPTADDGCMEPVPLGSEDRAILALESDVVAGHTCKVVRLRSATDLDALRRAIAARIERAPALTRRLGGDADSPAWVEAADFQLADHVVPTAEVEPLDEVALRAEVARLFGERLDRSRPLWRIDVAQLADDGSALLWRIHHALADGTAAMRLANALLWDETAAAVPPSAHSASTASPRSASPASPRSASTASDASSARRPAALAGFLRRELPLTARRSPFDGRIGRDREVAFATVPLHQLHDAAKLCDGASLNDAVLAIVAGALQGWLESHHAGLGSVRVKVPVSLHRPGDDAGNRDSCFTLPLPLGERDPVARLRAVHAATSGRKQAHDAETLETVLRELGRVSPGLRALAERLDDSPREFALNVSNVPGPCDAVSVLGAPVASLHSIAEIGERHALRVAVVSLAEQLGFGLCADPAIVPDLQALARGLEADAAALIAATATHSA